MDQRALFLHQVKAFVNKNGFILVPREQNRMFMAERGMTMGDLRQGNERREDADHVLSRLRP